jgi:hypothetical protein
VTRGTERLHFQFKVCDHRHNKKIRKQTVKKLKTVFVIIITKRSETKTIKDNLSL